MTEGAVRPVSTSQGPSLRAKIGKVAAASTGALILGELVSLVQTIALARLLSPAEVGFFVAGSVLTSFLGTFVEGGLRSGLVHREHRLEDAAETVFWATLAMGIMMSLAALAAAPVIGLVFHSHTAGLVAASMSGGVLLFSLTNVPEALLQRQFSVRRRLIVGPAVAISFAAVSVTLAALGFGVWSMVAGSYASSAVWVLAVWLICDWRLGSGRASFGLWRELVRFGFPLALNIFGERVQQVAQSVLVGGGLGASGLGLFRYGERIARIPMFAIVEVSSISLFPAFARIAGDPDRMKAAYLRALGVVTIGAAAVSAMLAAVGEPLVVVVLGETWRGAGVVLVAMSGLGLGMALITVSAEAIKGSGRTRLLNWYTLTEVGLGPILLLIFIGPLGLVGVGLSISVTAMIVAGVGTGLAKSVLGVSVRQIAAVTAPPVISALVALAAVAPLEHLVMHSDGRGVLAGLGLLTLDGVAFLVIYLAALWGTAPSTVRSLASAGLTLSRGAGDTGGKDSSNAAPDQSWAESNSRS